jgi:hypothetical protein
MLAATATARADAICAKRKYHRIRSFTNRTATCADCGRTDDRRWGEHELQREGTAFIKRKREEGL